MDTRQPGDAGPDERRDLEIRRRRRPPIPRRWTWFFLATAAALAVVALGITIPAVETVVFFFAALAFAASAARAARRASGRGRLPWRLLALTGALWSTSEAAWTYTRITGVEGPTHQVAHVLFLVAFVPAAVMLLTLIPRHVGPERPRQLAGALVITGSVFYLSSAFAPGVFSSVTGVATLDDALHLAFPIADIILASFTLIVVSGRRRTGRLPLVLVAAGFLSFAIADTAIAVVASSARTIPATLIDAAWIGGYLLLALAAHAPSAPQLFEESTHRQFERAGSASSLFVYVPLLSAMVIVSGFAPRREGLLLPVTEVTVLLLFGLRQALIARESAVLSDQAKARLDELQHTSASLARLAQQNERTIESVSDGIFGVDESARVTFANAAAIAMLDCHESEITGAEPEATFLARYEDAIGCPTENPIEAALQTGRPCGPHQAILARRGGSEFPVEWSAGPVTGDDGSILGAVVVFRDITRRRQLETAKDEFVSVVSHELRTPLTSIRGTLGLLSGGAVGPLSDRAGSLVRRGLESAERLTRLVDDLLDVDRLESGASTFTLTDCDADHLVRMAVDGVRTLAAGVPVELRVADVAGRVRGDADRVVQALTNLLGNAIKFSPPHSTITVSATSRSAVVEFAVADSGRGIPPDKLERIFERFEQVDSSDSRLQGGTGLGLAISRTIVRRHGGRIWVESTPRKGSTFRFTIPALAAGTDTRDDDAELAPNPATQAAEVGAGV